MFRRAFVALAVAALATACLPASAAEERRASPEDAQALVKKAIAYYKTHGREKTMAELSNKAGGFIDRDLYVNVYDMKGICLAHVNEKQIGRDLLELRDPDGKYIIRERIEAVKANGRGWQDYKWFNPGNKKIEPKRMYFEQHDGIIFAAGAYKPA